MLDPTTQSMMTGPMMQLAGPHTEYEVAVNPAGGAAVQDMTTGGLQMAPNLQDISFSDGVGRFDASGGAGEVARMYQAALGRVADPNGLDYWTAQLDSGTLGLKDVAMGFINSAEFNTAYGALDNQSFVQRLYQNVLHRNADSGGFQYWTAQLDSGTSRAQVMIGFSDSTENKDNTSATIGDKDRSEAYRLYQGALDRTPDSAGLDYWTAQLDNGASPLQVAQGFVNSAEFAQVFSGLDTKGFVDQLYQNALHRTADAGGEQYWIDQLNAGMSKAQVVMGFSDSLENRMNTSSATHDGWVYMATQS